MENMDATDVAVFELGAGERKVFSVRADALPAQLQGGYSVSGGERNKVTFGVFCPNGTLVYFRGNKKEVVFSLDLDQTGEYMLEFVSKNVIHGTAKCSTSQRTP